jgi:hypothetical protein
LAASQTGQIAPRLPNATPERETFVATESTIPHTHVHRLTRHFLEPAQDILVLAIGLALFGLMIRTIAWLVVQIFKPKLNFREVMAEVLFMLVMVEVVRLVISYLKEHRVAVDFMVELGIVATLARNCPPRRHRSCLAASLGAHNGLYPYFVIT